MYTKKHCSRMYTARFPIIHVLVADTMYQFQEVGIPELMSSWDGSHPPCEPTALYTPEGT